MWRKHLTPWIGLVLSAMVLAVSGGTVMRVRASPLDILYSQTDLAGGNSVRSTNGNIDSQDAQTGDDFTINCSGSCTIQSIFFNGRYQGSGPSPSSLLLEIYADSDTVLPGTLITSRVVPPSDFTDNAGDYTVTLNPPLVLGGGTWWVSVQATINSNSYTWTWDDRLAASPSRYPSIYRGAPNGLAPQCANWQSRVAICKIPSVSAAPDMLFEVNGIGTGNNLAPFIVRLIPAYVPPGSGDLIPLTIRGNSFVASSQVFWDGTPMATTFNSGAPYQVQIDVPAALLATRDLVPITVVNPAPGGGTSNTKYFLVGLPILLPVIRR